MSVDETNSFEFLKKISLGEVSKMGIETLKQDFGRVLTLDINDLKINIADEDRQLFLKINSNIRDFSDEYRVAGKWLDEEYNPNNCYQRTIKKLKVLTEHWQAGWLGKAKSKENQAAEILKLLICVTSSSIWGAEVVKTKESKELSADTKSAIQKLEADTEGIPPLLAKVGSSLTEYIALATAMAVSMPDTKMALQKLLWTIEGMPPLSIKHVLLADAVNNFLEDPTAKSFMSIEVARRICLITWILTEPDVEKSNLGITGFEKWPWTGAQGRFSLHYIWRGQVEYNKWVNLVKIAWIKIEAEQITEKPAETAIAVTDEIASAKKSQPAKSTRHWFKTICKVVVGIVFLLGGLWTVIQISESDRFKQFVASQTKSQSISEPNAQTDSNVNRQISKPTQDTNKSLPDLNSQYPTPHQQ
jgi:hypothetical protein